MLSAPMAEPGRVVRHHNEAGVNYEAGVRKGAGANVALQDRFSTSTIMMPVPDVVSSASPLCFASVTVAQW